MSEQTYTIYLIEDHRMKPYVGVTSKTPEERFRKHKNNARRGIDTHLYRAIRKYGVDNFEVIPLDTTTTEERAYELEKEWIDRLGTFDDWGYNMTPGGRGAASGKDHPMYGRTGEENPMHGTERSDYVKDRVAEANTGREKTKFERQAISERMQGNKFSAEMTRKHAGEIKWLALHSDFSQYEIADKYDTTQGNVSDIKREKRWPDAPARKPHDAIQHIEHT